MRYNNSAQYAPSGLGRSTSLHAPGARRYGEYVGNTLKWILAIVLYLACVPVAVGEEVQLTCKAEEFGLIHEIRFDEEAKTFFYRSTFRYISKKAAVDGWVPASKAVFHDENIMAEFKVTGSAKLSYLGAIKDVEGMLNRYTGMWHIKEQTFAGTVMVPGVTFQCEKQELSERKF